jgi:hypothetical protein
MVSIVIGMVLVVVVAVLVLSVFAEEKDDWTLKRPGREDPDEGSLDDFLDR